MVEAHRWAWDKHEQFFVCLDCHKIKKAEGMVEWEMLTRDTTPAHLGYLLFMLNDTDPRSARDQFDAGYRISGGCPWTPFKGHTMHPITKALKYPGDPPLKPIAATWLRNERIYFYPYAWVAIVQEDGSFEVCRMD